MGMDEIVNSENVINKDIDWDMFNINNKNYHKVGPNVLLASAIYDISVSIICGEKLGVHSSGIFYETIDKAIQYLDITKEDGPKSMSIVKLIDPYLYTTFILRDNDISNKENISKARLALTTLKELVKNPPTQRYEREKIRNLLHSYAEVLESPRSHPEANHDIDLNELSLH
jgi:hypothetical protein